MSKGDLAEEVVMMMMTRNIGRNSREELTSGVPLLQVGMGRAQDA